MGDYVGVADVGNRRILVLESAGGTIVVDLADGTWVSPAFVDGVGDNVVATDVAANELCVLKPEGRAASRLSRRSAAARSTWSTRSSTRWEVYSRSPKTGVSASFRRADAFVT
jgi:hypothetical protein